MQTCGKPTCFGLLLTMCDNGVKILILKWLENLKSIGRTVYRDSYYLNCKQTPISEMYLRFQGYVAVSPVIVCTTCRHG